MIVTCASCLTKFSLDESRIPEQGAKVRCSRCQHVFHIVPPLATEEEEMIEDFESFAKSHEDVIEPGRKTMAPPPAKPKEREKEKVPPAREERIPPESERRPEPEDSFPVSQEALELPEEEEEPPLFAEKGPVKPAKRIDERGIWEEENKAEEKIFQRGRTARRKKRGPSLLFALFAVLILLIFLAFYLWGELESSGRLTKVVEVPIKKVTGLWDKLWKTEREGLVIGDLNTYEEKVGEVSLFVIEGKVKNQSRFTKKYIKVKVVILDQDKTEVAEKVAICGPTISRDDFKKLPPAFFEGEIGMKPQTEKETVTPTDKSIPFMVIFKDKDLSSQAKEFKVQIVEAPNL
ncbi:MAG: hypothetical protein A2162_03025 [Deltaproteobacteria bacterium RBG_13_52_11b]|nr:MAG: hypothetical protein A2162_03025 [Deltaproteobacteria bacterium RBG_13_52_11b]